MRLPILYSGNLNAFDGIMISVLSIVKYTEIPLDIYILTMDLTEQNENFLPVDEICRSFLEKICKDKNPESTVSLIDIGDLYKNSMLDSPNAKTSYTPYAFLRLFADKIECLPKKILYLDTDTVMSDDISELYGKDINEYEFAGVRDYYGKVFFGRNYINSGVLLLNLNKIRQTGLFCKVIDMLNKKKVFLPDQTAINRLCVKKLILDNKYNEQKHFGDDCVIHHFSKTIIWFPFFHTKNIKPWNTESVKNELTHKYDDILDLYIEKKELFERNKR